MSDGGHLAATGDSRLGEDVADVDLAVFSVRRTPAAHVLELLPAGACRDAALGSVKGPDRPLLFASTGADREPLVLR
jgi:hypothetical protein